MINETLITQRAEAMMSRFSATIGNMALISFNDEALTNPNKLASTFADKEFIRARLPDDFAAIKRGAASPSLSILDRIGAGLNAYADQQCAERESQSAGSKMRPS